MKIKPLIFLTLPFLLLICSCGITSETIITNDSSTEISKEEIDSSNSNSEVEKIIEEPKVKSSGQWTKAGDIPTSFSNKIICEQIAYNSVGIPFVAASTGKLGEIQVFQYKENNWIKLSTDGLTSLTCYQMTLAFDKNDRPYLAMDSDVGKVMKYENQKWTQVGPNFSKGEALQIKIVFDNNNTPFLAFGDSESLIEAKVIKLSENKWVNLSKQKLQMASFIYDLQIDSKNRVYLMYAHANDAGNGQISALKRFENGTWTNLKSPDFSKSISNNRILLKNDIPYIIYSASSSDGKNILMRYEQEWKKVGENFSADRGRKSSFAINEKGEFISISEIWGQCELRVLKDDLWQSLGNETKINTSASRVAEVLFSPNGIPTLLLKRKDDSKKLSLYQFVNSK